MRTNVEILRHIGDLPNEHKPKTEYLAFLNAMKEAQIEVLDEVERVLNEHGLSGYGALYNLLEEIKTRL